MKKQLCILGTLLLLTIASSCSKDDDNIDPIVGTWESELTYENYKIYTRLTFNSDKTGEYYYTEAENGEEIDENNRENLDEFTYRIKDDKLTIQLGENTFTDRYIISNNKLTIFEGENDNHEEDKVTLVFYRKN